jgi:hypothetical protein
MVKIEAVSAADQDIVGYVLAVQTFVSVHHDVAEVGV